MEEFKYKVSIKKKYKLFFLMFSIFSFLFLAISIKLSIATCKTTLDYIAAIFVVLVLLTFAFLGIYQNIKSVYVYKGKIVYKTLFFRKEYQPIEIYCAKTKIVETECCISYTEGVMPGCGTWDKVTTFYNKSGKKLFAFGLAYENVSRLEKNITNNRKSINGSKNRR